MIRPQQPAFSKHTTVLDGGTPNSNIDDDIQTYNNAILQYVASKQRDIWGKNVTGGQPVPFLYFCGRALDGYIEFTKSKRDATSTMYVSVVAIECHDKHCCVRIPRLCQNNSKTPGARGIISLYDGCDMALLYV